MVRNLQKQFFVYKNGLLRFDQAQFFLFNRMATTSTASAPKRIITPNQYDKQLREQDFAVWTINDQQRLLALDALHDRMLSYHNNIHVKDSRIEHAGDIDYVKEDHFGFTANTVIAQVMNFSSNRVEKPSPLAYEQLPAFVKKLQDSLKQEPKDNNTHPFTWLHLRDPLIMEMIAPDLGIHELVASGFQDYRAHSNILPGNSEMILTFVTSVLESNDCNMYKLFIYVSRGLVVTFQIELLPDLTNLELSNPDKIVQSLISNHCKLHDKCVKLGPIYLVYELALRVLRMSDSSLEFISCALSYFNRVVHLNLLHRERLEVRIKMDMISSGVLLMRRSVDEIKGLCHHLLTLALDMEDNRRFYYHQQVNRSSLNTPENIDSTLNNSFNSSNRYAEENKSDRAEKQSVNKLNTHTSTFMKLHSKFDLDSLDHSSLSMHSDLKRILYGELIAVKHIPYLLDLLDAYTFIHTCLNTEFEETVRLQAELDGTIALRTTNTSTVLSLIATLFLPLTFLAGVFGMNFQENGGYTIGLLNYEYGPLVFSMMCTLCFIVIFTFFIYQGWIEIGIFGTLYKDFLHAHKEQAIDDSNKKSRNAEVRAVVEESRRKQQKEYLRQSVSIAARNFNFTNNSHTGSFSGSPSPSLSTSYSSKTGSIGTVKGKGMKTSNPLVEKLVELESLSAIQENDESSNDL